MEKRQRLMALGTACAVMAVLLIWQDTTIDGLNEAVFYHEKNIASLQSQLREEAETVAGLRRDNELLRGENKTLRDSIFWLENHVKELQDKVQFYEKSLAGLRRDLSKKDKFILFLQEKLAALESNPASRPALAPSLADRVFGQKPAVTEEKSTSITGRIGQAFMQKRPEAETGKDGKPAEATRPQIEAALAQTEREKDEIESKIAQTEGEKDKTAGRLTEDRMLLMLNDKAQNVARTTTVKFSNIALKIEKAGRPIDQLDKDGKNWEVTEMRIELSNPRPEAISEQKFVVEIVDLDSGVALPSIEVNPAFPTSANNTAGFTFHWRGTAVENTYLSRVKKTGRNYDLRVFYLFNGQKIAMPQATTPLLRDRKTV